MKWKNVELSSTGVFLLHPIHHAPDKIRLLSKSGQKCEYVRIRGDVMKSGADSRQVQRSRAAFLEAFNELVLTHRYDDIRISDIIRRANVGRSTFYEHFRNKDDLLRQSMTHLLSIFADAIDDSCDRTKLQWLLNHFRENLRLARALMNGPSCPQVVGLLASLIEERLTAPRAKRSLAGGLPANLLAFQIAESEIGLVRAWLNSGALAPACQIVDAVHAGAVALASPASGKRVHRK
jgi:AcrR family transcriptional regulator